jgi:ubiquinone/menaquinone biosynthesis C-methylase UbiE
MKKNFKDYSKYYDLFYKNKDYKKEVGFIEKYINKYNTLGNKLLSLGCGTCTYEVYFVKHGYKVTGIDISSDMLEIAKMKLTKASLQNEVKLLQGDVRKIQLKDKYDIIVELFNVVGYQNLNNDLDGNLKEVSRLLKKDGLFMFDCWHTPAVLKDKPIDKTRKVEDGKLSLIRKTSSTLLPTEDIIKINFKVFEKLSTRLIKRTEETHNMRYFSLPEISYFLEQNGLKMIKVVNFLDDKKKVTDDNWNIFVIAKKI